MAGRNYKLKTINFKLSLAFCLALLFASFCQAQIVQPMQFRHYSFPSQVNIGAGHLKVTNPSAFLELGDSLNSKKGFLPPRGYTDSITNPSRGLWIYDLRGNKPKWFNGTFWDSLAIGGGIGGPFLEIADTLSMLAHYRHWTAGYQLASNLSTNVLLGASDVLYPSQKAVKAYVDNKIATTPFQWDGTMGEMAAIIATTWTLSSTALMAVYTGTADAVWTMPTIASTIGRSQFIKNGSAYTLTLQRAGSDDIYDNGTVTSVVLQPGESTAFVNINAIWYRYFNGGSGGTSYADADVLLAPLTGYTAGSATALNSSTTILNAFRQLQAQMDAPFYFDPAYFDGAGTEGEPLTFIGETGGSVSIPVKQITYGTGSGITSDTLWTRDVTNNSWSIKGTSLNPYPYQAWKNHLGDTMALHTVGVNDGTHYFDFAPGGSFMARSRTGGGTATPQFIVTPAYTFIRSLQTNVTAPSTTGTIKAVVSDEEGHLSNRDAAFIDDADWEEGKVLTASSTPGNYVLAAASSSGAVTRLKYTASASVPYLTSSVSLSGKHSKVYVNGLLVDSSATAGYTRSGNIFYFAPGLEDEDRVEIELTSETAWTYGSLTAPGSGTVIVYDEFTASNGTALTSHTVAPTNVPGTAWAANSGTFDIQGNQAHVSGVTGDLAITTVNSGISDAVIESAAYKVSGSLVAGLIFRYVDGSNYWLATLNTFDNTFNIVEVTGGSGTVRATTSKTMSNSTYYMLQVTLVGDDITAKVDGGSTITYNSSSHNTATKHGLYSYLPGADPLYFFTFNIETP